MLMLREQTRTQHSLVALAAATLVLPLIGCTPAESGNGSTAKSNEAATSVNDQSDRNTDEAQAALSTSAEAKTATFESNVFHTPVRIKAGDEYVSVEAPGYACPTMADVDGDGAADLVVGQFNNGNMLFCKNLSQPGQEPEFAAATWLESGGERITVPGVW